MPTSMKPLFTGERAKHFLEETVVHSMEGVLFVLLSTLFTLAGAAAFLEDASRSSGSVGLAASAPAAPASAAVDRRPPQQLASLRQASYVVPAR